MSDLKRGNYAATQCGVAEHQWGHWSQVFLTLISAALCRADGLLEGMVDAGLGVDAISQSLGCTPTQIVCELESRKITIDDAQRDKKLRKRKGGWSPNDHMLLAAGWMSGVSITTIAGLVGRKPATVYGKKRRMGLPTRPRLKAIKPPKSEQTSHLHTNARTSPSDDVPESGESSSYCAGRPSNEDACAGETAASSTECVSVEAFAAGAPIIIRDAIGRNTPKQSETTPLLVLAQGGSRPSRETPEPADVVGWCAWFHQRHLKRYDLAGMTKVSQWTEIAVRRLAGQSATAIAGSMNIKLLTVLRRLSLLHLTKSDLPNGQIFDGRLLETMEFKVEYCQRMASTDSRGCKGRFYFRHVTEKHRNWIGLKSKRKQSKDGQQEKPVDTFETSIRSYRAEGAKASMPYFKCLHEPRISL